MEWFVNLQFVSKQSIFSFDSISVRDFYTPDNDIWLLDCVKGSVFGLDKSSLKALICSAFVDIPSELCCCYLEPIPLSRIHNSIKPSWMVAYEVKFRIFRALI